MELNEVVYECKWSQLPSHLKARTTLKRMGYVPKGDVVAKIRFGSQYYDLYDSNNVEPILNEEGELVIKKKKRSSSFIKVITKNDKDVLRLISVNNGISYEDILLIVNISEKRINKLVRSKYIELNEIDGVKKYKITSKGKTEIKCSTNREIIDLIDIEQELVKHKNNFIILDTETTGTASCDEIIQLSIIDLDGNVLINQYFNPKESIHYGAFLKHKIKEKTLRKYPKWSEKWEEISEILKGKTILIHNESFDRRLIEQTCLKYGIKMDFELRTACTMRYTNNRFGISKLESVLEFLDVKFNSQTLHNALIDCYMCLYVINPEAEVFNQREKAERYFKNVCQYKINQGDKKGIEKGLNWLKEKFNICDIPLDFNYFGLDLCNQIIRSLEPCIFKLKI